MKPPIVPEQPVPVVPEDGLRRLLKACEGKDFEARRDTALIMLLLDTGARRDELMSRKLTDLDLELDVLVVLGKGSPRPPPLQAPRQAAGLTTSSRTIWRPTAGSCCGCCSKIIWTYAPCVSSTPSPRAAPARSLTPTGSAIAR
jgi:hypothetical protein